MNKFIFLTICILSFGLQLHAEEVDTLNSRSIFLDEVVVQSFKQNKSYRMEPISASAFSSTGIVNRNITGIPCLKTAIVTAVKRTNTYDKCSRPIITIRISSNSIKILKNVFTNIGLIVFFPYLRSSVLYRRLKG